MLWYGNYAPKEKRRTMVDLIIFATVLLGFSFLSWVLRVLNSRKKESISNMSDSPNIFSGQAVITYRVNDTTPQSRSIPINGGYENHNTILINNETVISILRDYGADPDFIDMLQQSDEAGHKAMDLTVQDALTIIDTSGARKVGKGYHYSFNQKELAEQGVVMENLPLYDSLFIRIAGDIESIKQNNFINYPYLSIYILITALKPNSQDVREMTIELGVNISDPITQKPRDAVFVETTADTLRGIKDARNNHRSAAISR